LSTHDLTIDNQTMPNARTDLNNALQALGSVQAGTADPDVMFAYELQARTDLGLVRQRNAANAGWKQRCTLAETYLISRSSNTILGTANLDCTIVATGTFTQTFTAAATLSDGWRCWYRNDGSGIITLDPNASETIDGGTTLALHPGQACAIFCDGSNFKTVGLARFGEITNSLAADVLLNNVSNYFDGPSIAQGSVGRWWVEGTITLIDTGTAAGFIVKLWDGTNVIASAIHNSAAAGSRVTVTLSGFISSPAGNLRISAKDATATTGKILFNGSGESKDSTISAFRIG